MAEFPTLKESTPFSPVPISSGAEGYEAFAKTLGTIAETAEKKSEEIATDQSQAMFMNSVANARQVQTQAQIRMIENPGQAPKIASQTNDAIDAIQQGAYVNTKDRARLNYYLQGSKDEVGLKAAETQVKQSQNEAAFTHYANWPDQLKAYQQALISDPAKADTLHTAMVGTLHGLMSTGAITPEQAGSGFKDMTAMNAMAEDLHTAAQIIQNGGTVDAKTYQTIASNPIGNSPPDPNSPVNGSTGWMVNYYNTDKSFQGVMSGITNKSFNPVAFSQLKPDQRAEALQTMQGVRMADGMINSGEPFPAIQKDYDSLNETHKVLSYAEKGRRDYLASYIGDLKAGNFLQVMGKTPMGAGILHDFTSTDAAIRNSGLDDDVKAKYLLHNKNNLVYAAVSYGEGHHIPSQYIQPIPSTEVAAVQDAFTIGKDPSIVLGTLATYSKQNQVYVANAMKDPDQRLIVQAMAFSSPNIKPQDKLDFISANQKGRGFVNKEVEGSVKDSTMTNYIYTKLSDQMRFIGRNYDFTQAQVLQKSMLQTTLKYAKYLAQKDNDPGMEGNWDGLIGTSSWKGYVDKATEIYATSFNPISGSNYIVNSRQLPQPITENDLDVLANHAVSEGYKYLKQGRNDAEYESAIGRNPLTMVISPNNEIQAVDTNGTVYFSTPYSSNLLSHARESEKQRADEKRKAIASSIERSERAKLNVRLPNANTSE